MLVGIIAIFTGYCINAQAHTNELVNADALLVPGLIPPGAQPTLTLQARLDEALRLYRLGYGRRIVVVGMRSEPAAPPASGAATYLIEHAVDPSAIVVLATSDDLPSLLDAAQATVAPLGVRSYLLVTDPPELLRALKMARDRQMTMNAAPVKANAPVGRGAELKALWIETWRYLGYVLINR